MNEMMLGLVMLLGIVVAILCNKRGKMLSRIMLYGFIVSLVVFIVLYNVSDRGGFIIKCSCSILFGYILGFSGIMSKCTWGKPDTDLIPKELMNKIINSSFCDIAEIRMQAIEDLEQKKDEYLRQPLTEVQMLKQIKNEAEVLNQIIKFCCYKLNRVESYESASWRTDYESCLKCMQMHGAYEGYIF